jgi:hypothetical protein
MKALKIILALLLSFSFLLANDFAGKYIYKHQRYTKTVVLNEDGSGEWTYHGKKSSAYDYDEKISWQYNQSNNTIVIELVTLNGDDRIQSRGQKFTLLPKANGLFVKGSGDLIFNKI